MQIGLANPEYGISLVGEIFALGKTVEWNFNNLEWWNE